jgi:hypothetical protein
MTPQFLSEYHVLDVERFNRAQYNHGGIARTITSGQEGSSPMAKIIAALVAVAKMII